MSKPETPCLPLCGKTFHVRGCAKWPNAKAEAPPAPPQDAGNYVRCEGCIERGWNGYCTACHPACGCRMIVTFEGVNLGVIHHCRKPAPPAPKEGVRCQKCGSVVRVCPRGGGPNSVLTYYCECTPCAPASVSGCACPQTPGPFPRTAHGEACHERPNRLTVDGPPAPVSEPPILSPAQAQYVALEAERDALKAQNEALEAKVEQLSKPCRCGSGRHPRYCERHPEWQERHVFEINYENAIDAEKTITAERDKAREDLNAQAQELERLRDLVAALLAADARAAREGAK